MKVLHRALLMGLLATGLPVSTLLAADSGLHCAYTKTAMSKHCIAHQLLRRNTFMAIDPTHPKRIICASKYPMC